MFMFLLIFRVDLSKLFYINTLYISYNRYFIYYIYHKVRLCFATFYKRLMKKT